MYRNLGFAALPETVPTGITTYLYGAVQSTHISINCARFLQKGRGGLFRSDGHSLVCEKKVFSPHRYPDIRKQKYSRFLKKVEKIF